jgi:hypothetical protein
MRVAGITVTAFAQLHRLRHSERSCGLDHGADLLAVGAEQGCEGTACKIFTAAARVYPASGRNPT